MRRTVSPFVLFVLGFAGLLGLAMYVAFAPVSADRQAYMMAIGTAAISAVGAAVVLSVARRFGRREPWGRQWLLVGLGVASFAAAQIVRALDVASGSTIAWLPSPDVFIIAQYVLIAAASVAVAQSYRMVTNPRRPTIIVVAFGALALGFLWFGLIVPFVLPNSTGVAEALRTSLYPTLDILLLLVPAAYVALSLAQLGGVRFARPWYLVATAAAVLALSDAALVWLEVTGSYLPGTIVDFGPLVAQLLIATGALAAARLAEEFMAPAVRAAAVATA